MVRYVWLVVHLPDKAAEQMTELARQQRITIDSFVASMIEDWLEQRRKEARLGRKNQAHDRLRIAASEDTRGD